MRMPMWIWDLGFRCEYRHQCQFGYGCQLLLMYMDGEYDEQVMSQHMQII